MGQQATKHGKAKDAEELPFTSPETHYHMSTATKDYRDINTWISRHSKDPAYNVSPLFCAEHVFWPTQTRISFLDSKTISLVASSKTLMTKQISPTMIAELCISSEIAFIFTRSSVQLYDIWSPAWSRYCQPTNSRWRYCTLRWRWQGRPASLLVCSRCRHFSCLCPDFRHSHFTLGATNANGCTTSTLVRTVRQYQGGMGCKAPISSCILTIGPYRHFRLSGPGASRPRLPPYPTLCVRSNRWSSGTIRHPTA